MKRLLIILLALLLCGCSTYKDLDASLDEAFSNEHNVLSIRDNNTVTYYNYYLPSDLVEYDYKDNILLLGYKDSNIILNLNIPSIINEQYYKDYVAKDEGFFDEDKLVYSHVGTYSDLRDREFDYFYRLYQYDDRYLLHLMSRTVNIYSSCNKYDVVPISSKMLLLARTIKVDEDDVVTDYSTKDVIDYHKKQVNLFDLVVPVNGKVEELLID